MSPKTEVNPYASQLLSSQDFFQRSTRVLTEDDSNYRPHEGMMTVAQQVAHVAQVLGWFVDGAFRPESFDLNFEEHAKALETMTSLTAAQKLLEAAYSHSIGVVSAKSPEEMAKLLPDGPIMGGQATSDIVWAMIEHTAHHRGALTVYSRMLGKVPPMPYAG